MSIKVPMAFVSALTTLLVFTAPAAAQALTETTIRSQLFGLALTGEYATGAGWSEVFHSDGTSLYTDNTGTKAGTMTFKGKQICFRYGKQSVLSGGCFEVWMRGQNCFDFYGTNAIGGTDATYTQKSRGLGWDARGWNSEKPKDCVADLVS